MVNLVMAHLCLLYSAFVVVFMAHQGVSQSCPGGSVVCSQCPTGFGPYPACNQCVDSRLDPSSCCTQCKHGEEHCLNGSFDLTIFFHSYANPKHLCGECREQQFGPSCCDYVLFPNKNICPNTCGLRMFVSVEAFSSPPKCIPLTEEFRHPRIFNDDIVNFPQGQEIFNGVSNPYIALITAWTERFQLYIITIDFHPNSEGNNQISAVDRFLIDVNLGAPPAKRGNRRYFGIYNVSYFDISFDIKCSPHYYGQDCNTFCLPAQDFFACDEMGRKICVNRSCDPATNCLTCSPSLFPQAVPTTTSLNYGNNMAMLIGGLLSGILSILVCTGAILFFLGLLHVLMQRNANHKVTTKGDTAETLACGTPICDGPIYEEIV